MSDPATLAWYQANAPRYAHADNLREHRHLAAFLARLSPGARILELGCGAGQDTAKMIERTKVRMSAKGRSAFAHHLEFLREVLAG